MKNCYSQNNVNDNYKFNLSYVQRNIIYSSYTYIIFNRYEFVFRQLTNQEPLGWTKIVSNNKLRNN